MGFILWAMLVMDGNEQFMQERFATMEACRNGEIVLQQMADSNNYMKLRQSQCVPTE